jgi:hypothetical protein
VCVCVCVCVTLHVFLANDHFYRYPALLEATIEAGIYTILPCSKHPGVSTPFKLFVHSEVDAMEFVPVGEDQSFVIIKKGRVCYKFALAC